MPVPHFGVCLDVGHFKSFAERLKGAGVDFIIEPHLRFQGAPGEQWTMFFKDPSNNNLEFKAMTNPGEGWVMPFVWRCLEVWTGADGAPLFVALPLMMPWLCSDNLFAKYFVGDE